MKNKNKTWQLRINHLLANSVFPLCLYNHIQYNNTQTNCCTEMPPYILGKGERVAELARTVLCHGESLEIGL